MRVVTGLPSDFDLCARPGIHREIIQDRPIVRLTDGFARLSACLSPQDGGELSSIMVRDDKDQWHELLFRGNDWRPAVGWPGHAPWLWPLAGRCSSDGSNVQGDNPSNYRWLGRVHRLPHHGFIRQRAWHVVPSSDGKVRLGYASRPEDKPMYPFDYTLSLTMGTTASTLALTFTCTASSANQGLMPFTFGLHLSFDLASWWGDSWLAGHAEGFTPLAWTAHRRPTSSPPTPIANKLELASPILANALIPAHAGRPVRLVSPRGDRALSIRFESDPPAGMDQPVWVVYRDPDDRFFCWEPWIGWPDGMNTGLGRVDLHPGQAWSLTCHLAIDHDAP